MERKIIEESERLQKRERVQTARTIIGRIGPGSAYIWFPEMAPNCRLQALENHSSLFLFSSSLINILFLVYFSPCSHQFYCVFLRCFCCLPCNHCSNWTWVVGRKFGLLVVGCVLRTVGVPLYETMQTRLLRQNYSSSLGKLTINYQTFYLFR